MKKKVDPIELLIVPGLIVGLDVVAGACLVKGDVGLAIPFALSALWLAFVFATLAKKEE